MTTRRRSIQCSAPLLALAALGLTACPGRLANPELFVGGGGDGGTVTCSIPASRIEQDLVQPRCATSNCHDRSGRAGGLDLQSPNVASRLVGVPSSTCRGMPLVVQGSSSAGIFLDKLGASPMCGARMPQGQMPLRDTEMACIRQWVASLGSTPPPPDVVMMDVTPPPDVTPPMDVRPDNPPPRDVPPPMDTPPDMPPPPDVPPPMDVPPDMPPPPPDAGEDSAADAAAE